MSWASMRKTQYIGGIATVALLIFGVPALISYIHKPETCFDGKQNQDERGVDCGGVCERLCDSQAHSLTIVWSRSFEVSDGVYNALAYIENPNTEARVDSISYMFSLYDDRNILVAEREGRTFLSPNTATPIFEAGIETGERKVARTFFTFRENPVWKRSGELPTLRVSASRISNEEVRPRIDATIINSTVDEWLSVEVVAVAFDENDNALAASRTTIPRLDPRSESPVVFTWPRPFSGSVSRIEIIPRLPQ